ncbi:MAG: 30S ribosomal protein S20 [Candidatus Thioglobus sp.]|nr:MAG: 30S ribosomal protein S20 [Candidatus Thioglobus sp.]
MANTAQARKRARQAVNHRARNMSQRSNMRTAIKRFNHSVQEGDTAAAETAYREVTSSVDRAARKGLAHPNQAARLKSRLNARLKTKATAAA